MKDRTKTQAEGKDTAAEFLTQYQELLLKMRKETEDKIVKLSQQEGSVSRSDYDEVDQFHQEKNRIWCLLNIRFAYLKRINSRMAEVKRGDFTGKCRCGSQIEREVLLNDPRRDLCIKCQKEENGKKRIRITFYLNHQPFRSWHQAVPALIFFQFDFSKIKRGPKLERKKINIQKLH